MSSTVHRNTTLDSPTGFLYGHAGAAQIGKARDFINRIGANDETAYDVSKRSFDLAKKGFTGRTPKASYLISVQRSFGDMPETGTIISSVSRDKEGLFIKTVRLSASKLHVDTWDKFEFELGLSMSAHVFTTTKEVVRYSVLELAFFGIHSLSRAYQRGGLSYGDVTDAVLMEGIGKVFLGYGKALEDPLKDFEIEAIGGVWRGKVCYSSRKDKPGGKLLRIQTFSSD